MGDYEKARQQHLDLITQYCHLSKARAEGPFGQALVQHIKNVKKRIAALETQPANRGLGGTERS